MKFKLMVGTLLFCLTAFVWASDKTDNAAGGDELQRATQAIEHMTSTAPDKGIPHDVFEHAKCVAVIPKLVKGAFVIGGEHGRGVATCRTNGNWSGPAPFEVSGVSWGAQIGGESSDVIMFFMNEQGMNNLMEGHVKVGADVSAAAGPVGRQASADAGYKAGILTYSGSKGAFIGASLSGAELHADKKLIKDWYGRDASFKDVLTGNERTQNADARAFVNAVQSAREMAQAR